MVIALTYVVGSVAILTLLTFVYVIEDIQGKRVFLTSLRLKLDGVAVFILTKLSAVISFFTNGFVRLLLHYGAHSVLKRILNFIRKLEKKVEDLVRQNKMVAKRIGSNKKRNHLDEIAEHKEETALSEKEKEERLSH